MQHELIILSSSPGQPLLGDGPQTSCANRGSDAESAATDLRLSPNLLLKEGHGRPLVAGPTVPAQLDDKTAATNSAAEPEQKKKRTRRKKDDAAATAPKKKRAAEKTTAPDGGQPRKTVRKNKATGPVSTFFAAGEDRESNEPNLMAADRAGSPPPRRRTAWTPPKDDRPSIDPDDGFVQISAFEYKEAQAKGAGKQSAFTIGRKIEVRDQAEPSTGIDACSFSMPELL
jgi:hypothetical protein